MQSECGAIIREIQDFHMNTMGWDDIGFNFLVDGDGRAYEGCGYTIGEHTKPYNQLSIYIAFIGNFTLYRAPEIQLVAALQLINYGINTNNIHPDYVLYGQQQLENVTYPGVMLYNQIILWPHYSEEVIPL